MSRTKIIVEVSAPSYRKKRIEVLLDMAQEYSPELHDKKVIAAVNRSQGLVDIPDKITKVVSSTPCSELILLVGL